MHSLISQIRELHHYRDYAKSTTRHSAMSSNLCHESNIQEGTEHELAE